MRRVKRARLPARFANGTPAHAAAVAQTRRVRRKPDTHEPQDTLGPARQGPAWERPRCPLPPFRSDQDDNEAREAQEGEDTFAFMLVDVTYTVVANRGVVHHLGQVDPDAHPRVTELLLMGVGEQGETHAVHVHGFMPSFDCDSGILLRCPPDDHAFWCARVQRRLAACMRARATERRAREGRDALNMVYRVSVVHRKPLYTHYVRPVPMFHIELVEPGDVPLAKRVIWQHGLLREAEWGACYRTYEPNIEFVIRNMIDSGTTGCGWITLDVPLRWTVDRVELDDVLPGSTRTTVARVNAKISARLDGYTDMPPVVNVRRHIDPAFAGLVSAHDPVPVTTCDVEVDVNWRRVVGLDPDANPRWARIAPLVIQSYDIEVKAARRGEFPVPEKQGCQIIDIGNLISVYGATERHKLVTFCLGRAAPPAVPERDPAKGDIAVPPPEVFCFDTEEEELLEWARMVEGLGVDITTGYNIYGFDGDFMYSRAEHLGIVDAFADRTSKLRTRRVRLREAGFANKARGAKRFKIPSTVGNVQFDCLMAVDGDFFLKVRSKKLDNVAGKVLGRHKVDVHHTEINGLHETSDETRRRLVEYVNEDAILPLEIIEARAYIPALVEQARVCHVPLQWMLTKGQQVKVIGSLLPFTKPEDWVLPYIKRDWLDQGEQDRSAAGDRDEGYQGATVLDPKTGYYDECVVTLDFSSLYPSIMQWKNLCYSTLLAPGSDLRRRLIEGVHYDVSPEGHAFLRKEVYHGVIPRALEAILRARSGAKKAAAAAKARHGKNSPEYKREDSRQGALKIAANSMYGFTGAIVGRLPCPPVAESVTAYGRYLIEWTKAMVESMDPSYHVVYGDTDSVMVHIRGCTSVAEAIRLGEHLEAHCNARYERPIHLELENVYYPWLLQGKKMYAGVFWEHADAPTYIKSRGLTNVRRDNALFASKLFNDMVETLFAWDAAANSGNGAMIPAERDPATGEVARHGWDLDTKRLVGDNVTPAIELIHRRRADLYAGRIQMSDLVISQAFSRPLEKYKTKLPHTGLIARMRKRDAASAPQLGDRVPYVVLKSHKGAPLFTRTEDPRYAVEHNLPIDVRYYDETQCQKPILRFMTPIFASRLGVRYRAPDLDADEVPEDLRNTADYRARYGDDAAPADASWIDALPRRPTNGSAHAKTLAKLMDARHRLPDPHAVALSVLFPPVKTRKLEGPGAHSPFYAFRRDTPEAQHTHWEDDDRNAYYALMVRSRVQTSKQPRLL